MTDSGRLAGLMPQLRELLYLLEDGQIERAVIASDRRPAPVFDVPEYETEVRW